jgi:phosphatidylglycerol:prolipoprotein diacylglycerol transferase
MHPVLIEIGPLSIRYYGLMYVLGIIAAIFLIRSEVHRKGLPLTDDDQTNLLLLTVFAGILGARLYYVVFNWSFYRQFLWEIPAVWRGGLAFHGGVIGGTCAVLWFAHRKQIPVLGLTDVLAPPLILGQALGRFGNFMNGDAHGAICCCIRWAASAWSSCGRIVYGLGHFGPRNSSVWRSSR